MAIERTLTIIKPDGVEKSVIGEIISRFEKSELRIAAMKMLHLSKEQAEGFYYVHREKPFFDSLVEFMTSGPCVVMVVEGENAISKVRELMGATDPSKAAPGTIRRDFATDIEKNTIHGSDSPESASFEIPYFFSTIEIVNSQE